MNPLEAMQCEPIVATDAIWETIRAEAEALVAREPALVKLATEVILKRRSLEEALSMRLSRKLHLHATPIEYLKHAFCEVFRDNADLGQQVRADIEAVYERDPACTSRLSVVLFYKGFAAVTTHRFAHHFWTNGRKEFALYLQSLGSEVFGVDIHPAAKFGSGIFLDHATSFVAGETAEVADHVSILHEVTLGGTGKERGDRHPKVGSHVLLSAGAKILGNIRIGEGAKIGAGSVVLEDVPPHTTVVGVPGRVIGRTTEQDPSRSMDQSFRCRNNGGGREG